MKKQKVITCKSCGAELEQGAKACSACGKKCGKPFYKKVWFWGVIVVLCAAAGAGWNGDAVSDKPAEPATNTPDVTAPVVTEIELSSVFDMSEAAIKEEFGEPTIEKWEDGASFTYSFPIGLYVNRLEVNGELCENEIFYTKGGASQEPNIPLKLHGISFDMTAAEVKEKLGEPLLKLRMEDADPSMGLDSYFLYYVNDKQEVCVFFDDETRKVTGISSMFADLMPPVATDARDLCEYVGMSTTQSELEELFSVTSVRENGLEIETTAATFRLMPFGDIIDVSLNSNYFHVNELRVGDHISVVDEIGSDWEVVSYGEDEGYAIYQVNDLIWDTPSHVIDAYFENDGTITGLAARIPHG